MTHRELAEACAGAAMEINCMLKDEPLLLGAPEMLRKVITWLKSILSEGCPHAPTLGAIHYVARRARFVPQPTEQVTTLRLDLDVAVQVLTALVLVRDYHGQRIPSLLKAMAWNLARWCMYFANAMMHFEEHEKTRKTA